VCVCVCVCVCVVCKCCVIFSFFNTKVGNFLGRTFL